MPYDSTKMFKKNFRSNQQLNNFTDVTLFPHRRVFITAVNSQNGDNTDIRIVK